MPKTMRLFFVLSGDNPQIAEQEIIALLGKSKSGADGNYLVADGDYKKTAKRLAFCHGIYQLLFECKEKELLKHFSSYSWDKFYKNSFCLRIHNSKYSEREYAGYIWNEVKNPKVDLENPSTLIECFFSGKDVYCCRLIEKVEKHFEERKNQKRPFQHPTTLHPKLARAMVNLTGAKKGETILDPMCGTGGILIEAGLIGMKAKGTDINKEMVGKAKQNLMHFGIKKYSIKKGDALKIGKCKYVVTDLPYGKNTKSIDVNPFYNKFLNILKKNLSGRAVIGFPDFVDYKKLLKKNKFKIDAEFSYYLHKSLSKKIVVIS